MKFIPFLFCVLASLPAWAIQVDPVKGDDRYDGVQAPVRTIARAVKLAGPGDTVHLAPATYYESVVLNGKQGLPGKPITVEGHGAVIDGSDALQAEEWESLGQGLYRKVKLLPRMDDAILMRWYFLWDGRVNRMGRSSKGIRVPLKKVEELLPNEWTYVEAEDAFYVKLPADRPLAAANIRIPVRANGVALAGKGAHVVIRNLTATHVYNDGFNVHGDQIDTVYENIASIECGDDGFSAHETAECRIDGFVSIGNSTGLCDVGASVTHYKNVYIGGCHGHDVFFLGDAAHSLENAWVESQATLAVTISQHVGSDPARLCRATFKNVFVRRQPGLKGDVKVTRNAVLEAENCTFEGLNFLAAAGADVSLTRSVLTGSPDKPQLEIFNEATWKGVSNHYDLQGLRKGPLQVTEAGFAAYQKKPEVNESDSVWASATEVKPGIGADIPSFAEIQSKAAAFQKASD